MITLTEKRRVKNIARVIQSMAESEVHFTAIGITPKWTANGVAHRFAEALMAEVTGFVPADFIEMCQPREGTK